VAQVSPSVSFRDPSGRLLLLEDRVVRLVHRNSAHALKSFLKTRVAREFSASGRLVKTWLVDTVAESDRLHRSTIANLPTGEMDDLRSGNLRILVEHERIAFRSFPYEWPPEMLYEAGKLMLDLADAAFDEGFLLKDATPYNILFAGSRAVFVDLLSFEPRDSRNPTWLALNQFAQTILLPLLVNKGYGLRLDQLLTVNRDGVEPSQVAQLAGPMRKLSPSFLSLVSIPHWLNKKQTLNNRHVYQPRRLQNHEMAGFVFRQQLKRLRRQLKKVAPRVNGTSAWLEYNGPNKFFPADYRRAKENFVAEILNRIRPRRVLDVGCNTGYFSRLAARMGASVVAIDQDPQVVGAVWRGAAREQLDILPLVVNLARPTPAFGWRNEECPSFLDRARLAFDTVLMLAVLHHLQVVDQIPLPAILRLAAELTTENLIIELVLPGDPMFRHLVRGRDELYAGLTRDSFESAAAHWFDVVAIVPLSSNRTLYQMRKRG